MPLAKVNPAGGSGLDEGRDGWCTPLWLAELIGEVYLDPCSNLRSHILAHVQCDLSIGGNGLLTLQNGESVECWYREASAMDEHRVTWNMRTFINPPYARHQVIRWIRAYRHTRFIFLLRWDPSTKWFAELLPHCTHVWFPNRRVNFEPPPGVVSSSNPYPHALYLRDPSSELVCRLQAAGYLIPVDTAGDSGQSGQHGEYLTGDATGGEIRNPQHGDGDPQEADRGRAGLSSGLAGRRSGKTEWAGYEWRKALASAVQAL